MIRVHVDAWNNKEYSGDVHWAVYDGRLKMYTIINEKYNYIAEFNYGEWKWVEEVEK